MVLESVMKQIYFKLNILCAGIFFSFVFMGGLIYSEPVEATDSVQVSVERYFEEYANSVALNETINFVIDLKLQGENLEQFEFENPQPRFNQLRLLNTEQEVKAKPESQEKIYRFIYNLQPDEEGPASVGKLYFEYRTGTDSDFFKKPISRVNIMITPAKYDYMGIVYKVLGIGLGILVLVLMVVYLGPLLKREKPNVSGDLQDSPYERFQAELFIQKAKLDQDQVQDYFAKSEKWLKNLLSTAVGSNLSTASYPELQLKLRDLGDQHAEWLEMILQIAKKCEDVKFAGYRPTHGEKHDLYLQCEEILNYAIRENPNFDLSDPEENETEES